jgi:hypothetical protein
MSFLKNLFGGSKKKQTLLDDVQEVGGKLLVTGYRHEAATQGCAPTSKTSDKKIIEIYSKVGTAFQQAAERRGELIPATILNFIVLKFLQVHEMMGDAMMESHLQYEIENYLATGLRPDYRRELHLF